MIHIMSIVRDNPITGEGGMPGRTDDLVGRMYLDGAELSPTVENVLHAIAFGTWEVRRHDSERHPETIEILVTGRKNILIHRGTIPPHSLGCVLVPKAIERYLAKIVLPSLARGERWLCHVHEPPKPKKGVPHG